MALDFLKRLADAVSPKRRVGFIMFQEKQWDAPANTPVGRFVDTIRKKVRVKAVSRDGWMARVTCECDDFEPVPRGGPVPQYLPSVSVRTTPEGEESEVTFKRKGA